MIDRTALRRAYRPDEQSVVAERLDQARLDSGVAGEAQAIARALVKAVRGHKAAGLDAFLQAYDLGSDEGVALLRKMWPVYERGIEEHFAAHLGAQPARLRRVLERVAESARD